MKQKIRQMIGLLLSASLTAASAFPAGALPAGNASADGRLTSSGLSPVSIKTEHYQANIDLQNGGTLALSKNSDLTQSWNTMTEDLKPGSSMFWDGNDTFSSGSVTSQEILSASTDSYGVQGIQLGGDAQGVKSYFLFEDEILCVGAEMSATNGQSLIQVVDNIPVDRSTLLSLTTPNNGFRNVLAASQDGKEWASLKNAPVKQTHSQRNWLSGSDLPSQTGDLEYSYVFGNGTIALSSSNVFCRLNTKGTDTPALAELWFQPDQTWQYTLVPGKNKADYPTNALYQTKTKLLANTRQLQAAADTDHGVLSIVKWENGLSDLNNSIVPVTLNQSCGLTLKKDIETGLLSLAVSKPANAAASFIEVTLKTSASKLLSCSDPDALSESTFGDQVYLKLDASKMTEEPVLLEIQGKDMEPVTGDEHTMVRGDEIRIERPEELTGNITLSVKFQKPDGTFIRNVGSSKIKWELEDGQSDGTRHAGDTDGSHIASASVLSGGDIRISAKEKGHVTVVATDENGQSKSWKINVLYEDPANLPEVSPDDFATIRKRWVESLIGVDLPSQTEGPAILETIDKEAQTAWESYAYRGQDSCPGIPWTADKGAAGNDKIPYENDAVEFRPAMKKVMAMAKAYAAEGSAYYRDPGLFSDIVHILDYLCTECYAPKSQTDNWWTWEIGIPKELVPIVLFLYDDLTEEQVKLYTDGLYFFQPDPFHEGAIGTGSTHAQGYRDCQGANLTDCSRTALGLGILREDNELVYLAQLASSTTFIIQEVENSTKIPQNGYTSGFYADGSYLDHSHIPYLGAYGVEFLKGAAEFPPLLADTPWAYPEEVQQIFEAYIKEGLLSGMYDGLMLDFLKGRSVSRPDGSNRDAGRQAMSLMLRFIDYVSESARDEIRGALKAWMELDPGFLDTLTGAENMGIKEKAMEILNDDTIDTEISPLHKNFPLMDRAIHRSNDYLFALSMYSERIQNTEIMNHENRYGWHQGSGMTYLYNGDVEHYTTNFWNTVNPLRLAGTTLVSKNIGNGTPDSSGFAQGGDFRSKESWVGGSSIGLNGINGMSMTGEIRIKDGEGSPAVPYSDNFRAKKSWFMFGDEILCLGAGITNSGEGHKVETIVENRHLSQEGDETFQVNGQVQTLPVQAANVKDIVEGNVDVSGQTIDQVSWAHLDGKEADSSIGYYFPEKDTTLSVRKGSNTGDWADIGTSKGIASENYLELWFDHGENPQNDTYSYVLLPGMSAEETAQYADDPQITILSNTDSVQAAYSRSLKLWGANFWKDQKTTLGSITVNKAASIMTQEDENGVLTIAIADPTMKNTGSIVVEIDRPITEILECDPNVTAKETDTGVTLTIKTKNTNGASSYAKVQLAASIEPEAITLAPGDTTDFAVCDYDGTVSEINWRAEGISASLDPDTFIDSDGHLTISPSETNTGILVFADLDETTTLQAVVSLGGSISPMPEDMQKLAAKMDEALASVEQADDLTDPAVQKSVRSAVDDLRSASNDDLAHYLMDRVIRLEDAYIQVLEAAGFTVASETNLTEDLAALTDVSVSGGALNIPWKTTATASDASRDLADDHDIHVIMDITTKPETATPANAVPKTTALTAAVASPSDADLAENVEVENAVTESDESGVTTAFFQLKLQKGDETQPVRSYAAPVQVRMTLDGFDPDTELLTARYQPEQGKSVPLALTIHPTTGKITFALTGNGQVTFTKTSAPVPEDIYHVTLEEGLTGGYLTASPLSGKAGTKITVTAVPDKDFRLDKLFINGAAVTFQENRYTFSLEQDTVVTATFVRQTPPTDGDHDHDDDDNDDSAYITITDPNIPLAGGPAPAYAVTGTWEQNGDQWFFRLPDGQLARSTWICTLWNGIYEWFYFDQNGLMQTGWLTIDGQTFYLQPVSNGSRGVMLTGWQQIDETWYHFNPVSDGTRGALKR